MFLFLALVEQGEVDEGKRPTIGHNWQGVCERGREREREKEREKLRALGRAHASSTQCLIQQIIFGPQIF